LALDPILAALSSTVEQIHATKVKLPSEKIPPSFQLCSPFFAGLLSYQSYQSLLMKGWKDNNLAHEDDSI
jgi:hypothetical protein